MSALPEHVPPESELEPPLMPDAESPEVFSPIHDLAATVAPEWREERPAEADGEIAGDSRQTLIGEPMFAAYTREPLRPPTRFPNIADVGLVTALLFAGWMSSGALLLTALHFHLFGVSTVKQAMTDIHYTLGSQAVWYVITFGGCLLLFPAVWHKSFFEGIEWRAFSAFSARWHLASAVMVCLVLALVDGILMPGPDNTPIDQIFRMPGAAWLLFAFGVTLAPFFEELAFRGFLLPALCTAYDWTTERISGRSAPWPDPNGFTQWSWPGILAGSLMTSIPFALMHAEQTGYSVGPFLLLVCVSLVLCWVRLSTRSLAASVLVHSCYNFLLFSLMVAGTGGFKHLDKM